MAERDERVESAEVHDTGQGQVLITVSWSATVGFIAVASAATAVPSLRPVSAVLSTTMFVAGTLAFVWAYLTAIARSREVLIGMGGLFFLIDTAPRRVRRGLMSSFAVEVAVALVTASIGISQTSNEATNPLAFGSLAPMFGLGVAGLWGARHGTFAPRPVGDPTNEGPSNEQG